MSDHPLQPIFISFERISNCVRTQVSQFIDRAIHPSPRILNPPSSLPSSPDPPISNSTLSQPHEILAKGKPSQPVTKDDLGRATWTFLHTLAAQYPERPTRQQKKDVKELQMAILSRMYPCKECADHFKEVLRSNPVEAGSQTEFSQWMCHVHNVVNRSLGKTIFPCERVDARWGKLDCEWRACDLQGTIDFPDKFL